MNHARSALREDHSRAHTHLLDAYRNYRHLEAVARRCSMSTHSGVCPAQPKNCIAPDRRWPSRTDTRPLASSAVATTPVCPLCTNVLFEPRTCTGCSYSICLQCYLTLAGGAAPTCPGCRARSFPWLVNRCARDVMLASPEFSVAYSHRHDEICADPRDAILASIRSVLPDARVRWTDGITSDRALHMIKIAARALMEHNQACPRDAQHGTRTDVSCTITRPAGSAYEPSVWVSCASEWDEWVEVWSPTIGQCNFGTTHGAHLCSAPSSPAATG